MHSREPLALDLPTAAFDRALTHFGVYLHVPFCATRCGYCDFNTYTAGELGTSASPGSWEQAVIAEIVHSAALFREQTGTTPTIQTIFVGGGTPSLVGAAMLVRILDVLRAEFPVAPDCEITTEANPESTSPEFFAELKAGGFTRISLGMQSASSSVLRILDRTHTPGRALTAIGQAHAAGFAHLNLDLIYGTPGESRADLQASLDAVLSSPVDHVSAYSLIVEDGTALARKIRRGEMPPTDDDDLAWRYEFLDAQLQAAGFRWYEVSNWAQPGGECRHNLGYWHSGSWWGYGPGAHSHLGGHRFANSKHPATYASQLATGRLPIAFVEHLSAAEQHTESVMLALRLREGVARGVFTDTEWDRLAVEAADGLVVLDEDRVRLTEKGRLLADGISARVLD